MTRFERKPEVVMEDLDETLTRYPDFTTNYIDYILYYNKSINESKVMGYLGDIRSGKLDAELGAAGVFEEFHKGGLTIWQDREACLDAVEDTVPAFGAYEGNDELDSNGILVGILSAARSIGVNYMASIKFGMSTFWNRGTPFIYDKNGIFTGRHTFRYRKNRAIGYRETIEEIYRLTGKEPAFRIVVDNELPSQPFIEAMVKGWFIWLSASEMSEEIINKLEKSYPYPIKIIQKPEVRDNFELVAREILKMRKLERAMDIPSWSLKDVYEKVCEFEKSRNDLINSVDTSYDEKKDAFLSELTDLLSLKFPFDKRFKINDDIRKLRASSGLSEGKDLTEKIADCLLSMFREHDILLE